MPVTSIIILFFCRRRWAGELNDDIHPGDAAHAILAFTFLRIPMEEFLVALGYQPDAFSRLYYFPEA